MRRRTSTNRPRFNARGSVMVIVLWTIAIAAIIVSSLQLFAYRQATVGRESLERIQARWAARAGVENTIAAMTRLTQKPDPSDAKALTREMYNSSARYDLLGAAFEVLHHANGRDFGGPADEHAKFNLNNTNDRGLLLALDDMTLDVLDAIADWMDEDDEPGTLGVERDYYLSLDGQYEPRNGALRTLGEIELIAGIWPRYFRGEDWNLNGRLDANENDSSRSFPPDEPDGIMQAGWSENITVYSVAGGPTDSGEPRILLKDAEAEEVAERCGITEAQAEALLQFGQDENNQLTDLLFTPLGSSANQPNQQPNQNQNQNQNQPQQPQTEPLTDEQLKVVLAECAIQDPKDRLPGKINLNTVDEEFLRDMLELVGTDEAIVDELLYLRDRPQGISNLVELKTIPSITPDDLRNLTRRFDVVSNVFTIASRGRSVATGVECEIVAVVDRSTIPVRILEYREQ
jgi:hypothetical protein